MDDHALLTRLATGDQSAVGDLYDRYGRQVFALAVRMLNDRAAAEDVTQEVFVKVWRNASRFDAVRGSPATWILHIAHTTTVDALRSRRVQPERYEQWPEESDPAADPVASAELADMGAQVRGALMRLPAEQRHTLELAYFGALTQSEIATRLQVPLGTVKGRIRLGLEALRHLFLTSARKEADQHERLSPRR
jgi:RNA polymerase sigma-70 factor (ECF subfamily)